MSVVQPQQRLLWQKHLSPIVLPLSRLGSCPMIVSLTRNRRPQKHLPSELGDQKQTDFGLSF